VYATGIGLIDLKESHGGTNYACSKSADYF
jgi:hypothetical protein